MSVRPTVPSRPPHAMLPAATTMRGAARRARRARRDNHQPNAELFRALNALFNEGARLFRIASLSLASFLIPYSSLLAASSETDAIKYRRASRVARYAITPTSSQQRVVHSFIRNFIMFYE